MRAAIVGRHFGSSLIRSGPPSCGEPFEALGKHAAQCTGTEPLLDQEDSQEFLPHGV
jgi:hypothetical protein